MELLRASEDTSVLSHWIPNLYKGFCHVIDYEAVWFYQRRKHRPS